MLCRGSDCSMRTSSSNGTSETPACPGTHPALCLDSLAHHSLCLEGRLLLQQLLLRPGWHRQGWRPSGRPGGPQRRAGWMLQRQRLLPSGGAPPSLRPSPPRSGCGVCGGCACRRCGCGCGSCCGACGHGCGCATCSTEGAGGNKQMAISLGVAQTRMRRHSACMLLLPQGGQYIHSRHRRCTQA